MVLQFGVEKMGIFQSAEVTLPTVADFGNSLTV